MASHEPDRIVKVYQPGTLTVIGFDGRDVLDDVNVADCKTEIAEIVRRHQCRVLAVDLTGVKFIPSGLLGLLASLREIVPEVHLYNPSPDVREVLEITRLDQIMPIHEVEL
ncbi:MAG: STAS domain-containing protein [Planctomycetales bacterium]